MELVSNVLCFSGLCNFVDSFEVILSQLLSLFLQICRVDVECISSHLTFQHLSLMCRNARVRSPVGISPLNGVARSSPLDPFG
jgi:hypothetical protein